MLLSLCMPTNGISEWVFPSLDSIYNSSVDESLFEVIVTDNGNNVDDLITWAYNEFADDLDELEQQVKRIVKSLQNPTESRKRNIKKFIKELISES